VIEKPDIPIDRGLVGYAARHRQPVVVGDVHADARYIKFHEETCSELSVPLITKDKLVGVLDIENASPNYFREDHVQAVTILASQLAVALDNAMLYDRITTQEAQLNQDLRLARELQKRLLPGDLPVMSNLAVCTLSCAARIIAGDMVHFAYYPKRRIHVGMLGDVAGKGAAAALYGALTIGIIRSFVEQELSPAEMLKALNQALMERAIGDRFVALAYALWDDAAQTLHIANSGLPRPIRYRDGKIDIIEAVGMPLGLFPGVDFEEHRLEALPGDVFLLLTDGILEACNPRDEEFGYEGVEEALRNCRGASEREVKDALRRALTAHCDGVEARDDQTLLVLRVRDQDKGTGTIIS
jgi:sigma-B regulation protein RsbU (phosphoserine phosphatase)